MLTCNISCSFASKFTACWRFTLFSFYCYSSWSPILHGCSSFGQPSSPCGDYELSLWAVLEKWLSVPPLLILLSLVCWPVWGPDSGSCWSVPFLESGRSSSYWGLRIIFAPENLWFGICRLRISSSLSAYGFHLGFVFWVVAVGMRSGSTRSAS